MVVEFAGGFLDDGKFGLEGREGVVADGVGFLYVGGDVFVGLGEVGEEWG